MKNEPFILCIETATTVCSVAVSSGGSMLALREIDEGYTHAENLHVFIDAAMKEAGIVPEQLNAVALSAGPGSYTGLRIGSTTAKGLCFALQIPLITIPTLKIMAAAMSEIAVGNQTLCPMLDAGRMEVYTAIFDQNLNERTETEALELDENTAKKYSDQAPIVFGGTGAEKAAQLLKTIADGEVRENLKPSAAKMHRLAAAAYRAGKFTEIADFEPFYLKKYLAGKKKKDLK